MTDLTPPRIVATDLDGTLVRTDGSISARTTEALHRVADHGADLIFVTGRPPRWMHDVAVATGHLGLAICANGAILYDLATERVVSQRLLESAVVAELTARLREALPDIAFAAEYGDRVAHESAYRSQWDSGSPQASVVAYAELAKAEVPKLLARHPQLSADELLAAARRVGGELAEITHSSRAGLVEISAIGVSKATALERLCADRGVAAADVLAFGDMPNDLPMLAWAGHAVAVANAHPDVLAAVAEHTASNDDDGVAEVLERVFR